MALLTSRAQIEADIQVGTLTTGTVRTVTIGAETTYGHYRVEPQVDLGEPGVIHNVKTLVVPQDVPGLTIGATVTITEGSFKILYRFPGSSPNLVKLVLGDS